MSGCIRGIKPLKLMPISALSLLLLSASSSAFADKLNLQQLSDLILQGKNQQAYEQATKFLDEFEGDPQFDYYYGVAAIDSGHISQGVFALQRVVLLKPNDNRARLELARGYFLLQEDTRARQEFNKVLKNNPPEAVVANVERFLNTIRLREARDNSSASAYVELALGHDSNINSAPADANFFSPVFGNLTLGNASREDSADFVEVRTGGKLTHPFAKGKILTMGFDASSRQHSGDELFETEVLNIYANVSVRKGKDNWRVGGQVQEFEVGEDDNRSLVSLNGEWSRQLDKNTLWTNAAQVGQLGFPGQTLRDSSLYTFSTGLTHRYEMKWKPTVTGIAFVGIEDAHTETDAARSTADRRFFGARIAGQIIPAPKWSLSASLLFQNSHYQGENIVVGSTRNENFYQAGVNARWLLDKNWSTAARLAYSRNDSNSPLSDYDRTQTQVSVRYDF